MNQLTPIVGSVASVLKTPAARRGNEKQTQSRSASTSAGGSASTPKLEHSCMISRVDLAKRWGCSVETLKRREKAGVLHGLRFSSRMVRYDMDEVARVEGEASTERGGRNE